MGKTKYVIFHNKQRNTVIENIASFNFLGIHVGRIFNTEESHVLQRSLIKLSKIIGILNRLKYIYPQQTLLTIYNSLFISHVLYGFLINCQNSRRKLFGLLPLVIIMNIQSHCWKNLNYYKFDIYSI